MYARIVPALFVLLSYLLSAAPTQADVALPPGLLKPYDGTQVEVSCQISGKTVIIYLHTPGPCDYTAALYDEDGKALEGPTSGSLQRFGGQTLSVRTQVPELKKGETRQFRYKAQGRFYNYHKVPISEDDDGKLAALGRNMLVYSGLADPSSYRYELQDKNGKTFDLDIPIILKAEDSGISAQCRAKR